MTRRAAVTPSARNRDYTECNTKIARCRIKNKKTIRLQPQNARPRREATGPPRALPGENPPGRVRWKAHT